jgi:hypothetical protein
MSMRYAIFTLLLTTSLVFAGTIHAQLNQTTEQDVNVDMIPENPGPNQAVSVTLTSFATDINAASITWKVNDKTQKTGRGEKVFNFTTGGINTTTTLDIQIITAEGQLVAKTFDIKPVGVDLLWQSGSFVPPFYKVKRYLAIKIKSLSSLYLTS